MIWLVAGLVLAVCFGGVLLFGAPYLPTLSPQIDAALDLARLQPGDHLLELGCGDGKVLLAAARRGIYATGYELNPLLVVVCKIRTLRYRKLVRVHLANFWRVDLPPADAVFVFLLPRFMARLDQKMRQADKGPSKLVSFAFQVPDKPATAEHSGVYLYTYTR